MGGVEKCQAQVSCFVLTALDHRLTELDANLTAPRVKTTERNPASDRGQNGTGRCYSDETLLERVLQRRVPVASLFSEDVVSFFGCDAAGPIVRGRIVRSISGLSIAGTRTDCFRIRLLLCTRRAGPARCSVTCASSSTKLPVSPSLLVAARVQPASPVYGL